MLADHARGETTRWDKLLAEPIILPLRRASIVPRTLAQKEYLQSMLGDEIVLGLGPAGTGKTYLAMAAAVHALASGKVRRILLTRPAVEAGEALGFLPGDLREKILPYLIPLYDALHEMLGKDETERLVERNVIEVAPLAYMRGRTLTDAFVVLDEAQNATPEQMLMFLTRLGERSRMVVTGDPSQIDLPRGRPSGLAEAAEALRDVPGIVIRRFDDTDVVRHPLVERVIRAYARHRKGRDG
jgi:phosphate starvation-inducible PhoH-like protein